MENAHSIICQSTGENSPQAIILHLLRNGIFLDSRSSFLLLFFHLILLQVSSSFFPAVVLMKSECWSHLHIEQVLKVNESKLSHFGADCLMCLRELV